MKRNLSMPLLFLALLCHAGCVYETKAPPRIPDSGELQGTSFQKQAGEIFYVPPYCSIDVLEANHTAIRFKIAKRNISKKPLEIYKYSRQHGWIFVYDIARGLWVNDAGKANIPRWSLVGQSTFEPISIGGDEFCLLAPLQTYTYYVNLVNSFSLSRGDYIVFYSEPNSSSFLAEKAFTVK